jgi:hypothetical protein
MFVSCLAANEGRKLATPHIIPVLVVMRLLCICVMLILVAHLSDDLAI